MRARQNALVDGILACAQKSYKRDHASLQREWHRREAKIAEAQSISPALMRKARGLAGCNKHDSVPVRVAGIDEKSPKRPEMRGKYYRKYSWKHPAGFRVTEYEPSTRYVCVSVSWVRRQLKFNLTK